ncbi:MAG: glycine cleavage system protein GcvH [Chitinophagaceae bacterium]|mgnify:CR=1 FL=1|nr:glycine cleavage system protein GcvH [Chitinophagaceae bacterium]
MNFPKDLRYTKDHEWIRLEGDVAVVGITEFAQSELGDIVYVEIETLNQHLGADSVFGTVEAVKTVSDLFLPVTGTITEINPGLNDQPELINNDPYGEGWMIKLKPDDPNEIAGLLTAEAYASLVQG